MNIKRQINRSENQEQRIHNGHRQHWTHDVGQRQTKQKQNNKQTSKKHNSEN